MELLPTIIHICIRPSWALCSSTGTDRHYRTYLDFVTELRAALDGAVSTTKVQLSANVVIGGRRLPTTFV